MGGRTEGVCEKENGRCVREGERMAWTGCGTVVGKAVEVLDV